MLFSEIMKLEFWRKCHKLLCILQLWRIIDEKCVVTPNFLFGFSIDLIEICFSSIAINCAKILLYWEALSLTL